MKTDQTNLPLDKGLYLILTDPPSGYEALTRLAVEAGVPAIQLRYKGKSEHRLFELAQKMRRITEKSKTLFIVNDRPDIALKVNADGVHVGQEDLDSEAVRKAVGKDMLVGLSTHNLKQVEQANLKPVDYIGFGPLFNTTSKVDPDPVVGPQMLSTAAKISRHPIVAIGGLTIERIERLDLAACRNVAVISAVANATNPFDVMQTINRYAKGR